MTKIDTELRDKAEEFADTLNRIIEASIDTNIRFRTDVDVNAGRANLQPEGHPESRSNGFPLIRQNDNPKAPSLLLATKYALEMDREAKYLQVASSTIGLWVDTTGGRKNPRPLIRVEYDRRKTEYGRSTAHVHIHAHSPELSWVYGSSGQSAPDLHRLHFPVGGRRFRPTLEDFLMFLDREKLYTDFKKDWKSVVLKSLDEWEETQAAATARRFPGATAQSLERLGYTIVAPTA